MTNYEEIIANDIEEMAIFIQNAMASDTICDFCGSKACKTGKCDWKGNQQTVEQWLNSEVGEE